MFCRKILATGKNYLTVQLLVDELYRSTLFREVHQDFSRLPSERKYFIVGQIMKIFCTLKTPNFSESVFCVSLKKKKSWGV